MKPLQRLSLKTFFFAMPAFALWFWVSSSFFTPFLTFTTNSVLSVFFASDNIHIVIKEDGLREIRGGILLKPEYTIKPNHSIGVKLGRPLSRGRNMTIGFPILWAFMAALSVSWRYFLGTFLAGSILLLLPTLLNSSAEGFYFAALLILETKDFQSPDILGLLQPINGVSAHWLSLLATLRRIFYALNTSLVPLSIIWVFNKKQIKRLVGSGSNL